MNTPLDEILDRLNNVLNDENLPDEDIPQVEEVISKVTNIRQRNPLLGLSIAS